MLRSWRLLRRPNLTRRRKLRASHSQACRFLSLRNFLRSRSLWQLWELTQATQAPVKDGGVGEAGIRDGVEVVVIRVGIGKEDMAEEDGAEEVGVEVVGVEVVDMGIDKEDMGAEEADSSPTEVFKHGASTG